MTSRRLVFLVLALFAINGALNGYFEMQHLVTPKPLDFSLAVAILVATYLWYYNDAREQKYRRTALLGGAIILLSVLSVPYYLYSSRPPGAKGKALLHYLGFCFLGLVVSVLASLPFVLITPEG